MSEAMQAFIDQEAADASAIPPCNRPAAYTDDDSLPPAVRDLVEKGRRAIAAAKEAKEAAERSKLEEARNRVNEWLSPVRQIIEWKIPAALLAYVVYPAEDLTNLALEHKELWLLPSAKSLTVLLQVPGCELIKIPVQNHDGAWHLPIGCEFQPGGRESFSDLAMALAHARNVYVKSNEIPF